MKKNGNKENEIQMDQVAEDEMKRGESAMKERWEQATIRRELRARQRENSVNGEEGAKNRLLEKKKVTLKTDEE